MSSFLIILGRKEKPTLNIFQCVILFYKMWTSVRRPLSPVGRGTCVQTPPEASVASARLDTISTASAGRVWVRGHPCRPRGGPLRTSRCSSPREQTLRWGTPIQVPALLLCSQVRPRPHPYSRCSAPPKAGRGVGDCSWLSKRPEARVTSQSPGSRWNNEWWYGRLPAGDGTAPWRPPPATPKPGCSGGGEGWQLPHPPPEPRV